MRNHLLSLVGLLSSDRTPMHEATSLEAKMKQYHLNTMRHHTKICQAAQTMYSELSTAFSDAGSVSFKWKYLTVSLVFITSHSFPGVDSIVDTYHGVSLKDRMPTATTVQKRMDMKPVARLNRIENDEILLILYSPVPEQKNIVNKIMSLRTDSGNGKLLIPGKSIWYRTSWPSFIKRWRLKLSKP